MYYYDNKFNSDLDADDLILDYLMYRKTSGVPRRYRIKEHYEIGKGWPHYKDVLPYTSNEVEIQDNSADYFDYEHEEYEQQSPAGPPRYVPRSNHEKGKPPYGPGHGQHDGKPPYGPGHGQHDGKPPYGPGHGQHNVMPPYGPGHGQHNVIPPYGPGHGHYNEHGVLKDLYCDHCRRILPHIEEVLSRYDYEGSPIYAPIINRMLLDEIIEKVMIASRINDRNLIEALLLPEIFHSKRYSKHRR